MRAPDLSAWDYYRPPWYPNTSRPHNPWAIPDPLTGKSNYTIWVESLPPGELLRLIAQHQETL